MTDRRDPDAVASLFTRARRHETQSAPGFQEVVDRPRRTRVRPRVALLGSAAVLATAATAAVLVLSRQEMAPPADPALPGLSHQVDASHAADPGVGADPALVGPEGPARTPTREAMSGLAGLGYLAPQTLKKEGEFIQDLPAPHRFYQSEQARVRVSGVANTDPLTGGFAHLVSPDSIEGIEVITSGAGVKRRIVQKQGSDLEATPGFNTERYGRIEDNGFLTATENPLSTFSIDVDTASYAVVRRYLSQGQLPPRDAVRLEELLNYFPYAYPPPTGDAPFSVSVEIASCPWSPTHRLARIGLKGEEVRRESRRGTSLVFLIDVSGSMDTPDKLPLLKSALRLLVDQLGARDQVAIVVYAGASGLVLPPTPGSQKSEILPALDALSAGGSTNGGEGLRLAYELAREQLVPGGVNRVILATDGDFNVGITDHAELLRLVEEQARAGIALTTLGFGSGNYKDDTLELLADRGNGNHFYIDDEREARKVLVEQIGGTLVTIAKDVKIQVEFNPRVVGAYRLLGYENRLLKKEDFNDDRKDAGEIGSGHDVTALYELIPPEEAVALPGVDPLKYQTPSTAASTGNGESFTVKLRYKEPDGEVSRLLSIPVTDGGSAIEAASEDLRFAASVAAFGMALRDSADKGGASLEMSARLAARGLGKDAGGYRRGFLDLVERARAIGGPR